MRFFLPCLAFLFLFVSPSCTSTKLETNDWSEYDGPGAEYFQKEEVELPHVEDPLEPMNRTFSAFNHGLMVGVIGPLTWVYRGITPKFFRTGVSNFFENLLYPVRLVNNLLQGKGGGAWDETKRFGVNTTYGVLGLWDRASDLKMEESKEDMGQTFGKWGWDESTYFVMPVFGPATIRDGLGRVPDWFLDPAFYFFPAVYVRTFNDLTDLYPQYRQLVTTNYDPYELGRLLYFYSRKVQVEDFSYDVKSESTGETETLGAVFLAPKDKEFKDEGKNFKVVTPATGKKLPYTIYLQPKSDETQRLIYYLPGTGGHRLSGSTMAIAEIGFDGGANVVTISNSLNFEFQELGSSSGYPGFLPVDAHDVHLALDAIDKDLEQRYPGRFAKERRLVGLSMGGMIALEIAAANEDPANDLIDFDAYLVLNTPINLEWAVSQLDAFYNVYVEYSQEERRDKIGGLFRKVMDLADGTLKPTGKALPFTADEAEFLIGLSFRNTLRDVIWISQERDNLDVLKTKRGHFSRAVPYQEINQFSFMEYMYAFVLPYYAEHRADIDFSEAGARRLLELSDLTRLQDQIRANDRVLFVENKNDPLQRPQDVDWINRTFGAERSLWFDHGGHAGNLFIEDVQHAISTWANATLGTTVKQ
jgi:ABC-type transporter lipoprotein component MlaA/pimeloyl-ACP methyl ester carboxylesterase